MGAAAAGGASFNIKGKRLGPWTGGAALFITMSTAMVWVGDYNDVYCDGMGGRFCV